VPVSQNPAVSQDRAVPQDRAGNLAAAAAPEAAVSAPPPGRRAEWARLARNRVLRSSLLRLVVRRLLTAIPVIWGVTFLAFTVLNLLPGDAAQALLGADATPAEVAALSSQLHLNEPFFTRYGNWLGAALTGHLGSSLGSGQPVTTILAQRLPVTFELIGYAFVISLLIAVPVATLGARKPGGIFDSISTFIALIGLSIAPYVLALLLILLFAVKLSWFPALGWTPVSGGLGANLRSLTLPALSLGFPIGCFYTRLLRADVIEQLNEDYVTTAQAKGLPGWRVLLRHATPNSMFGLITVVALNVGTLLGGTVIVEQIFGLPGVGEELFQAIQTRDFPVLEGTVVVFAVVVVVIGLLADLLYAVLDPRIRYDNPGQ
jgi:peptide/nickel transport system permease protein